MLEDSREQLLEKHIGLVKYIANKWVNHKTSFEDLLQEGSLALIKHGPNFDPECGVAFSTYITPYISGAISHYVRDYQEMIKPIRGLPLFSMCSLDAPKIVNNDSDALEVDGLVEPTLTEDILDSVYWEALLNKLPEQEKKAVQLYYYEDVSQKVVGEHLGCTQVHAGRVIKSAISKLKELCYAQ